MRVSRFCLLALGLCAAAAAQGIRSSTFESRFIEQPIVHGNPSAGSFKQQVLVRCSAELGSPHTPPNYRLSAPRR